MSTTHGSSKTSGCLDRQEPVLREVLKFFGPTLKTDPYHVKKRMTFRRKFEVAPHLAVFKYADMILMFETDGASQTDKFTGIFPCDKMTPKAPLDEEKREIARGTRGIDSPQEEFLPSCMSRLEIVDEELTDTEEVGNSTYEGIEARINHPEPIFDLVEERRGILHPRARQLLNPGFHDTGYGTYGARERKVRRINGFA